MVIITQLPPVKGIMITARPAHNMITPRPEGVLRVQIHLTSYLRTCLVPILRHAAPQVRTYIRQSHFTSRPAGLVSRPYHQPQRDGWPRFFCRLQFVLDTR